MSLMIYESCNLFSSEKAFENIFYVKCDLLTRDVITRRFSKQEMDFWSSKYEGAN